MLSPRIEVLYAVMARLEQVDLPTLTGIADLNLRWTRNRYTTREERPCLALAFVSDEPRDRDTGLNGDETARILGIDLIVDLQIETEAAAQANTAIGTLMSEFDPSGLADLSAVLDVAMKALRQCCMDEFRDTTALGKVCDWVEDVEVDEDEELPDDDGRLVGRANVIYRTSSWDPTLLLKRD